MERYAFSFPSTARAYGISADILNPVINSLVVDSPEKQRLKLIVSELVMNAYTHGNKGDPDKTIDVIIQVADEDFIITVRDQGGGLKQERFREIVMSVSEKGDESGRGMKIVNKLCDQVQLFRDEDDKFCIRAIRRINSHPAVAKRGAGKD